MGEAQAYKIGYLTSAIEGTMSDLRIALELMSVPGTDRSGGMVVRRNQQALKRLEDALEATKEGTI